LKGWKSGFVVYFSQFPYSWIRIRIPNTDLDLDPGEQNHFGSIRIRIRKAAFKHQGLNFKLYLNKTPTVKKPDAPETSGGVDVQSDFPRGLPFHHRTSSIRNDFSMTDRLQTSLEI
jgi:hypothetical protein